MLAFRDQENLVHSHQAAATSKSLNQLPPKTPSNRAPLGQKTTNAKARQFKTPAPDVEKPKQKSATARKLKPRLSHAEPVKIDVLNDQELEERDIEYMPPRPKGNASQPSQRGSLLNLLDLPDIPDDIPQDLDLSFLKNASLTGENMLYFLHRPDADGLSYLERKELADKRQYERADVETQARYLRDLDCSVIPCLHIPDCPDDECKDAPEIRRKAEEKYRATIAAFDDGDAKPKSERSQPKSQSKPLPKKVSIPKGPSLATSKRAAAALSQPRPSSTTTMLASSTPTSVTSKFPTTKPKFPASLVSSRKKTPPPTNPSPMRHTAAIATSNTTMGYSKGRAVSATLRKGVAPKSDTQKARANKEADEAKGETVGQQQENVPWRIGGVEVFRGIDADLEARVDEYEAELERRAEEHWMEEAEREFEFVL